MRERRVCVRLVVLQCDRAVDVRVMDVEGGVSVVVGGGDVCGVLGGVGCICGGCR